MCPEEPTCTPLWGSVCLGFPIFHTGRMALVTPRGSGNGGRGEGSLESTAVLGLLRRRRLRERPWWTESRALVREADMWHLAPGDAHSLVRTHCPNLQLGTPRKPLPGLQ